MSVHDKATEKSVAIRGVDSKEGFNLLQGLTNTAFDGVEEVKFDTVNTQSFRAEYAVKDGDIVFHFFVPKQAEQHMSSPQGRAAWMEYWLQKFPNKLDPVARAFFNAEYPRLIAKYTEEQVSWWLKAQGFGRESSDPQALCRKFLEQLDTALHTRS